MKELEWIIRKENIDQNCNPIPMEDGQVTHLVKEIEQYIIKAKKDLEKQIEAYKEVCEKYIPTDKLDEANSEVILICKRMAESMGRDLLKRKEEG